MKKNIFLVDNGIDIALLEKQIKNFPENVIYTLDYDIHKKLERKNISHNLAEDILNKDDFDKIDQIVIELTKNCFSKFKNSLIFNDIYLPELIEHEFFQYLLQQFLKPYIISKLIHNLEINSLIDFTTYSKFIKEIISNDIKYSFNGSSENLGLYHDKIIFHPINSIPFHLEISRKTFSKLKKPLQEITEALYNLKPNPDQKQNVLLVNFDVVEFENLLNSLKKLNVNYLILNTRKPAITNKKSLQIIKNSNSKIVNLNDFYKNAKFNILSAKKSFQKVLSLMFNDDDYFQKFFSVNGVSFWSSIKQSFFDMCSVRFIESIERIFLLHEFYNTFNIALNFLWIDVGQEEKECISVGKQFSVDSIMLQHGRFQTSNIWNKFASFLGQFPAPMLSDKQIVWGEITKQYALSYNHSVENILVGGSPRHDKFFSDPQKKSSSGKIILATTGTMFLSSDTCTTRSQMRYDDYFKEVYRVVKNLSGKELIVKSHPSQILRKIVQNLINEIDPSITLIEETNNQKLFNDCEMVITFNNSTTSLEAISQSTPVISLQTERWALEDDIAQSNAIVSISNVSDIEPSIKKIIHDNEFRQNLIKNSSEFLSNYMANQGNSSFKIAELLKNLIIKNNN